MVTRGQALYRLRTGAKGSGTLSVVHGVTWGQTPHFTGNL